ncbi:MAG TPA: ABC transporter ATP-binding protein [Mycobacteriales bacterium]|jgi:branched-chain amino acid transport system ATP-binding protein|nr:ABC transporter ATP-binding protein [Mycobacteriales bacterium]
MSNASEAEPADRREVESAVLEVVDITVRFGGLVAVSDVDLVVPAGEVTGLIGPNGAGKTTLFNVVSGLQAPTHGRVALDGTDITTWSAARRARAGIARTFQRLEVFGSLSVRDNVRTAAELKRGFGGDGPSAQSVADEILERVGASAYAYAAADSVPTGVARLVEIARALALEPKVLLLDEPSSGLSPTETDAFGRLLRELAAAGTAVLLVEHDVDLVMHVCDRLHVLDFGRMIGSGTPAEVRANPLVQAAYLGATPELAS